MQGSAVNLPKAITDLEKNAADVVSGPAGVRKDQMPTSGLLSQDPGLVSAEHAARQKPKTGAEFVERDLNVKGAAADRVSSVRDPNADWTKVGKGMEDRQQSLLDARDAEALPLLKQAQEAGATVDAAPVVAVIDQALSTAKRPAVRAALTEARKSLNAVKTDPNSADVLDNTVAGLYETRKTINDIIAGRGETPTGKYAQKELIAVRDALDDAINQSAPEFGQYLSKYKEGSVPLDDFKASADVTKIFDGKDPRNVATELLGSGFGSDKRAAQIAATVANNPEAKQAWKASVAEALYKRVSTSTEVGADKLGVSQAALAKEFKNNEKLLMTVFDPDEMSMLRQGHKLIAYFKEMEKRATVGSQTAPNLLNTMAGKAFQVGARHLYGNLEAGGIFRNVRLMLEMMPSNRQSVDEIAKMAWFDPGLMSYLLNKPLKNRGGAPYNVNLKRFMAADVAQQDLNAPKKEEKE